MPDITGITTEQYKGYDLNSPKKQSSKRGWLELFNFKKLINADENLQRQINDNRLTAGGNIDITGNVISAADTVYDDSEVRELIKTETDARILADSFKEDKINKKIDFSVLDNNGYPTTLAVENRLQAMLSSFPKTLKVPKKLDLESSLPPLSELEASDCFMVQEMDETAPQHTGFIWINNDGTDGALVAHVVVDMYLHPDEVSLESDGNGALKVKDDWLREFISQKADNRQNITGSMIEENSDFFEPKALTVGQWFGRILGKCNWLLSWVNPIIDAISDIYSKIGYGITGGFGSVVYMTGNCSLSSSGVLSGGEYFKITNGNEEVGKTIEISVLDGLARTCIIVLTKTNTNRWNMQSLNRLREYGTYHVELVAGNNFRIGIDAAGQIYLFSIGMPFKFSVRGTNSPVMSETGAVQLEVISPANTSPLIRWSSLLDNDYMDYSHYNGVINANRTAFSISDLMNYSVKTLLMMCIEKINGLISRTQYNYINLFSTCVEGNNTTISLNRIVPKDYENKQNYTFRVTCIYGQISDGTKYSAETIINNNNLRASGGVNIGGGIMLLYDAAAYNVGKVAVKIPAATSNILVQISVDLRI